MATNPVLGPVLYYRGSSGGSNDAAASYSVAIVVPAGEVAPLLHVEGRACPVASRFDIGPHLRWLRFDFPVALAAQARRIEYAIGGVRAAFSAPGRAGPWRIGYVSCNGHEREVLPARDTAGRNRMWSSLCGEHERRPIHLLVHGGDQVYADGVLRLSGGGRPDAAAIQHYYFRRYLDLWSQPEIREVLARVPALMTWDDHDIFDGWGSLEADYLASPPARATFDAAARAFRLFQRGEAPGDGAGEAFHWAGRLGAVCLVAPDTRSERTRERVLGEAGWRFLRRAVSEASGRRLLLVCTTPVGGFDVAPAERALRLATLGRLPLGDLRDQWLSTAHRREWREVVRLLADAARNGLSPAVLSGEIHVGALSEVRAGGAAFPQLISSGVAHPAPSRAAGAVLHWLSGRPVESDGVRVDFVPIGPGGRRILGGRNWLELTVADDGGLEARWHVDSGAGIERVDWREPSRPRSL